MPLILLRFFLLLASFWALLSSSWAESWTSITSIRALTPEQAARHLPVSVEAVVIYHNPKQPTLIAHDGREGIYVHLPRELSGSFRPGQRVRIEGTTQPGGFLPIIESQRVEILGEAPLPDVRFVNPSELFSPALDCQWVQVPAIITGLEYGQDVVLVAEISGWTVKLILPIGPEGREKVTALLQRPVMVRGVVGSVFNAQRQLTGRHFFIPSFDEIIPAEANATEGEAQLRAVDELLRSDATTRTRVRVRGIATARLPDGLYLRGVGGSVLVRATPPSDLAPGAQVEVEGFAAVAPFRPLLRAAKVSILGQGAAPEPKPLRLRGEDMGSQQSELVSIEAEFLASRDGGVDGVELQCRVGEWFFKALLPSGEAPKPLPNENDRIRLVGICEFTTTSALPFSRNVDGFVLHLRGPEDVAVVHHAPWWNLRRLFWALGGVAVVALLALFWAASLRRRVAEQTKIIGDQIERAAVKDERQRIARELHDTIEQELAGLSIQLRNARQRLTSSPEQAVTALDLAERMLRHCRQETRTSIRDLRSVALEQRGLCGAFEEFLAPLAGEGGARFSLMVTGSSRALPGPTELHLLRIAQEAVANAARHAHASRIEVGIHFSDQEVALEVRDDGRGFDATAPAPRGHFGVMGIRERANKLRATLTLESRPGAGTTVRVAVPSDSPHHSGEKNS